MDGLVPVFTTLMTYVGVIYMIADVVVQIYGYQQRMQMQSVKGKKLSFLPKHSFDHILEFLNFPSFLGKLTRITASAFPVCALPYADQIRQHLIGVSLCALN